MYWYLVLLYSFIVPISVIIITRVVVVPGAQVLLLV